MAKVDRDKTKRLNSLVLDGIEEIRGNKQKEQQLEEIMENFDMLSGEVRYVILNKNVEELPLSVKYLFTHAFFIMTKNEKYNLDFFYKSEIKSKFLNKYPANTQIPYARIFEKSKEYEDKYKKDLSEFTKQEISNVLSALKPLTLSASHVNGRIVTAYIDWCIENNVTSVKENKLKTEDVSFFGKFIDEELKLFFTYNELIDITRRSNNPQDSVIVKLLFYGIQGNALAEIRNMKKKHVYDAENNNNVIKVYDEDMSERQVQLDIATIELLKKAIGQELYLKRNGVGLDEKLGLYTNLVDNDYVIRTSITKTDKKNAPVEKMVIYRRIKTLGEVLGYTHLTTKNIVRSGMIYEASRRIENAILTKDDYIEIGRIFNIDNWYQIKKYCNPEIISKMYDNTDSNNFALV